MVVDWWVSTCIPADAACSMPGGSISAIPFVWFGLGSPVEVVGGAVDDVASVVVVSMKSLSSLALAGGLGCVFVRMSVAVVLGVCCAGFVCCGLGVCMLSVSVMVEVVCDGILGNVVSA